MIARSKKVMVVRALLVGFLVLAMVATGCGGDDDGEASDVDVVPVETASFPAVPAEESCRMLSTTRLVSPALRSPTPELSSPAASVLLELSSSFCPIS